MATIVGRAGSTTTVAPVPTLPQVPRTLGPQLLRYAVVGCLGTVVSAVLYLVFRTSWDAVPANLAAIALSTMASTEGNRRFTFHGAVTDHTREYVQNAGSVLFYAGYSSVVLVLLDQVVTDSTALQETVTVAAASVLGGVVRFLVLRNWVWSRAHVAA